jgi:hypothetical protein
MFCLDVTNRSSITPEQLEAMSLQLALYLTPPDADGVGIEASFPGYERQVVRLERRSAMSSSLLNSNDLRFRPAVGQSVGFAMLVAAPLSGAMEVPVGWGRILGEPAEWSYDGVKIGPGRLQLRA